MEELCLRLWWPWWLWALRCTCGSNVLSALPAFILGLRPKGQEPPGRSSFLGCVTGTEEIPNCTCAFQVSASPWSHLRTPFCLSKSDGQAQSKEIRGTLCLLWGGGSLELQDKGCGHSGEELGPFPPPDSLVAQVSLHRVNYSTNESCFHQ